MCKPILVFSLNLSQSEQFLFLSPIHLSSCNKAAFIGMKLRLSTGNAISGPLFSPNFLKAQLKLELLAFVILLNLQFFVVVHPFRCILVHFAFLLFPIFALLHRFHFVAFFYIFAICNICIYCIFIFVRLDKS